MKDKWWYLCCGTSDW